jgi:hypothetical protein
MGLSYFYSLTAPATKTAAELEKFLREVEKEALKMGFNPTLVFNAPFDTKERWEFARWFTTGQKLESDKLKGVMLLREGQIWSHDPATGFCCVIPQHGVLLVVTNEKGHEIVFGFLRYPVTLKDLNGKDVVETGIGDRWHYRSFLDSPDPRYRKIVKHFKAAGFLESEKDEYST